jgi:hypothetical protein
MMHLRYEWDDLAIDYVALHVSGCWFNLIERFLKAKHSMSSLKFRQCVNLQDLAAPSPDCSELTFVIK